MGQFDGKVALVTGAASGIGRATATRLADEGASVCCVDFDERNGKQVASATGGVFVRADAGAPSDVETAFDACGAQLGGVDIAFLNAGVAIGVSDLTSLDETTYRRIMRVNVDGVVFGTQAAIRAMRRRGAGSIVATASLAGLIPFPPDPVYDLTKHAVVGFIRSIAPTLVDDNITANTVNPGMTNTNILNQETKDLFAKANFPLMPPEQIADAVVTVVATGRTGECWVCQPGRDAEPYRFHDVPGPRDADAAGRRPPAPEGNFASKGQ